MSNSNTSKGGKQMAEEVSNKTIAILVAVVLVISVVGTWTILTSESEVDLDWYDPASGGTKMGQVKMNIDPDMPTNSQAGNVGFNKIQ